MCVSHGKACQPTDIWHHSLSKEEVLCVSACVCRRERRKMVVILTYGLDSSFLLGREEKNGYTEECSCFFSSVEWSGLREQRNQRKQKTTIFQKIPMKKNTHSKQMSKNKTPEGPLGLHFPFCQSVPLPSSLSLTQLAIPLWLTTLWTWLCCRRRGGLGILNKSCLIIPATITAGADSLWV